MTNNGPECSDKNCLKCQKPFRSRGPFLRMCDACNKLNTKHVQGCVIDLNEDGLVIRKHLQGSKNY